jgi:anti-sigma regulatory factor (Ser/Thr protein kinase)/ActR/RegA family two-component response regulator
MGRALIIGKDSPLTAALQASDLLRGHELERCGGDVEAVCEVRARAFDVAVTNPSTSITEDLALAAELGRARPGIRIIALSPAATHDDLIAALKAHVFACFTPPFDANEIAGMMRAALDASAWQDGIEVVSGLPHWCTLRVSSHLLTADRLVRFMTEHLTMIDEKDRDLLIAAFREMLLNAMEHGAGFDAEKVVEVTAARTARAIVYHFRDPGGGFDRRALAHAANAPTPEDVVASAMHRAELGMRPGGFGMLIARQVADELVYNERGNELLLIKHLD